MSELFPEFTHGIFSPPGSDSFRKEISQMRGPIGVKFCAMISNRSYFIRPFQNFGEPSQKIRGQKRAKFCPISDDFNGWRYSKSNKYVFTAISPALWEKRW